MVNEPNPYTSLGLLPGSSSSDIKHRYRQMAKLYHPDCNGQDPKANAKFREISAARDFLSDPARKAVFDAAFDAAYNPARISHPVSIPPVRRRCTVPLRAAIGLTMLVMLFSGVGVLFSSVNGLPTLAGLTSSKAVPDRPAPAYLFLPSSGPFDQSNANGVPVAAPAAEQP